MFRHGPHNFWNKFVKRCFYGPRRSTVAPLSLGLLLSGVVYRKHDCRSLLRAREYQQALKHPSRWRCYRSPLYKIQSAIREKSEKKLRGSRTTILFFNFLFRIEISHDTKRWKRKRAPLSGSTSLPLEKEKPAVSYLLTYQKEWKEKSRCCPRAEEAELQMRFKMYSNKR